MRTLLFLSALTLAGCRGSSESFSDLEPSFFSAMNVNDPQALRALAGYERRLDAVAGGLLGRDPPPAEREEIGRQLFYAGFFLHVGFHAVEDGYLTAGDLGAVGDAKGGDDRAALVARMERSDRLLVRAAELRPKDNRIGAARRSVRFNLDLLRSGAPSAATLDSLVEAAKTDFFNIFAGLILLRDPARHPMDAPYMEKLFQVVCGPAQFDCSRMGPPPMPKEMAPTLTQSVAGPVILSDLLLRRGEMLLHRADAHPELRPASLGEATGLLNAARGILGFAQLRALAPELMQYPGADGFVRRRQRLDALLAAAAARMKDPPAMPPLPDGSFYAGRAYRSAYQCVSCHSRAPGGNATGFPR